LLVVTVFAALWGAEIPVRSDMEDLFPEDSPIVQRAQRARELVGQRSELLVLVGSPSKALNRQIAWELAGRLREMKTFIDDVEIRRDGETVQPKKCKVDKDCKGARTCKRGECKTSSFFERNGLLYVPLDELEKLEGEVSEAIASETKRLDDDFDAEEELGDEPPEEGSSDKNAKRLPTRDELLKRYKVQGLSDYFESPDGQVIGIKVYPNFKPADTVRATAMNKVVLPLVNQLMEAHRAEELTITLEGEYSKFARAVSKIKAELRTATAIALGGICLILIFFFRSLRAMFVVLVPLVFGLAWTVFMARAAIGYLNVITAFIFAILVGLGIDFLVHGASRVEEEFKAGATLSDALVTGLSRLGPAMSAAGLTTVATFGVLVMFEFRGFSQFGAIAAMGVVFCLAAVYLVLPPLSLLMAKVRKPRAIKAPDHAPAKDAALQSQLGTRRWGYAILVVFTALLACAVYGTTVSPELKFEGDTRRFRTKVSKKASSLSQKYRKEAEIRSYAPALVVTSSLQETERLHRHMEGRQDSEPLLDSVKSIFSFIPEKQPEKLAVIAEIRRKIKLKYSLLKGDLKRDADRLMPYVEKPCDSEKPDDAQCGPTQFGVKKLPPWLKKRFTGVDGNYGRYVLLYFNGVKADARHSRKLFNRFGTIELDGKVFHSTATYYILAETYRIVEEEGPLAVSVACLVILLFLSVHFRRVSDVLMVFLPLVVGFVIFLGVLAFADISLNMFNIVVLPAIFGIGVDTAIHLVHRLNEGTSVRETLRTTGKAAFISSLTTAVGFLSLVVVSNKGLQSIGTVAAIGIACSYVASVGFVLAFSLLGLKGSEVGPLDSPQEAAPES
jgi:predicted RND superfamily exporter protein